MSLIQMLEKHEGRRQKVYKCTAGKNTIGVGHNIDAKGLPSDIETFLEDEGYITEEMIDRLLDDDIEDAITDCDKLYPNFHTYSENRQDALIDFLFNVGYPIAYKFKQMNIAIRNEDWDMAAKCLLNSKYARQVKGRAQDLARMFVEG